MAASEVRVDSIGIVQFSITDVEFERFRKLIYELAGISLSDAKRSLVVSRLSKRLRHHGLTKFMDYYRMITDGGNIGEQQIMVDLLTTNETYFFREPKHFELLEEIARSHQSWSTPFRVWSAAASSGEEGYTIAMVLDNVIGDKPWEVLGTDISTRVLEAARLGLYTEQRTSRIPSNYLYKYCLKGVRSQQGMVLVDKKLRDKVTFKHMNLLSEWGHMGEFDVIFLRNVMIYFDLETKQKLVNKISSQLKQGGYFLIGHSESLNGLHHTLETVQPSVYRKKV
ncbi:MAG: protein-glutamate O-methyltransferase CheR [Gammaproteobacteria bacterium]|nr:protein-glutamate O-methyltransferase CheR [Gammaproteobacteria bacterium]